MRRKSFKEAFSYLPQTLPDFLNRTHATAVGYNLLGIFFYVLK